MLNWAIKLIHERWEITNIQTLKNDYFEIFIQKNKINTIETKF